MKETFDKVVNCWKDKYCYGNKAVHDLLLELRLKSTMIDALYVNQCPKFKVSMNDYSDRIVTLEELRQIVSAKMFNELNVPQYLEYITREIVDISFEACKSEYATRW